MLTRYEHREQCPALIIYLTLMLTNYKRVYTKSFYLIICLWLWFEKHLCYVIAATNNKCF